MLEKSGTEQRKSGTAGNLTPKSGTVPTKVGWLETMKFYVLKVNSLVLVLSIMTELTLIDSIMAALGLK